MQIPHMPFKVLTLAPFSNTTETVWTKNPISVDKSELDQVMATLGLSVYISLPSDLCPAGGIDIKITRIKDFHPDQLAQNNDVLKSLLDAKAFLKKAKAQGTSIQEINSTMQTWPNLPPLIPETETPKPQKKSESAIDNILDMVALPDEQAGTSPQKHTLSKQIDTILEKILNHIYSDKAFNELESVWRGLKLVLQQMDTNSHALLEIVPVSAQTLKDTLDALTPSLVQELPSLIIVDLPFDNSSLSLEHLEKIADFAETLMVPVISWITKDFLYLDKWKDFQKLPFLPNHLDESHYAKWHKLEQSSAGRWLSVTCNCFPARYPYGKDNKTRLVDFYENKQLWTAPVWAAAALIVQNFLQTGWPTRFTDIQNIQLEDMPLNTEEPGKPIPLEILFTNDRMDQFRRIGIMPLSCIRNRDIVIMPVDITVAGISLQYQLLLTRLTHFIFWCLDNLSRTESPDIIEQNFKKAFALFWEKSGLHAPDDMTISAGKPGQDNKIPLRIALTPQRNILPIEQKIELEFLV